MNALVFQMLAARGNNGGNPAIGELLARMRSGGNLNLDPQQLLARFGNGNPAVSALAKRLEELKASAATQETSPVIDVPALPDRTATENAPVAPVQESATTRDEIEERVNALQVELKVLRERNDLLAQALGACCVCWGQSLECRNCRGRGGPGFSMPDESLVNEYVVPAIRTLRSRKAEQRNFSQAGQARVAEGAPQGSIASQ